MMKKQKVNKTLYIIPIISGILLIWYYCTNSVMEKLLILFTIFTIILPASLQMTAFVITSSIPKKKGSNSKKYKARNTPIKTSNACTYKKINNLAYETLRQNIILKNKLGQLDEHDFEIMVNEVDTILNRYCVDYSRTKFQNIEHELYKKIKDPHLKDEDYKYLLSFLISSMNLNIKSKSIIDNHIN